MESVSTYYFQKLYNSRCNYGDIEAEPYEITLDSGTYKIELWGSSGGCPSGGKGAYVSAKIKVEKNSTSKFYLFVGSQGSCSNEKRIGGCNGGGDSFAGSRDSCVPVGSGGGSTDLRTGSAIGTRILVAGSGGGGREDNNYHGGCSGTYGENGTGWYDTYGKGATQTEGGKGGVYESYKAENGTIWKGGNGIGDSYSGSGGGGGYYGGGGSYETASGGGSSYISNDIKGLIKSGNEWIPSPNGGREIGHTGNGFARITLLSGRPFNTCFYKQRRYSLYFSLSMNINLIYSI